MDVSLVLISYNPKLEKILATIRSVLIQKGIQYEIIVTDDGSEEDYFSQIRDFFRDRNVSNYKLVKNEKNQGIVRNYLAGSSHASGKYIKGISPGDMLHDEYVLRDLFRFCESNNCQECFGDVTIYSKSGEKIGFPDHIPFKPMVPEFYDGKKSRTQHILFHSLMGFVRGASMFRSKEFLDTYFHLIKDYSVYAEDNTSAIWAIVDGIYPLYYNRQVVYYEYGTGISTAKDTAWDLKIQNDMMRVLIALEQLHPENRWIRICKMNFSQYAKIVKLGALCYMPPEIIFLQLKRYLQRKQHPDKMKCAADELTIRSYYDNN